MGNDRFFLLLLIMEIVESIPKRANKESRTKWCNRFFSRKTPLFKGTAHPMAVLNREQSIHSMATKRANRAELCQVKKKPVKKNGKEPVQWSRTIDDSDGDGGRVKSCRPITDESTSSQSSAVISRPGPGIRFLNRRRRRCATAPLTGPLRSTNWNSRHESTQKHQRKPLQSNRVKKF